MSDEEFVLTWRIKNYSARYLTKADFLEIPVFSINDHDESSLFLRLYPEQGLVGLVCYFDVKYTKRQIFTISYILEILDEKGCVLKGEEFKNEEMCPQNYSRFCFLFSADELRNQMSSWEKDVLTLRCRIVTPTVHVQASMPDRHRPEEIVGILACTTFDVENVCIDWLVEIPCLIQSSKDIIILTSDECLLKITLNVAVEFLEISINFKEGKSESTKKMAFAISIFDKVGCKLGFQRAVHIFENEETWAFPDFLTREELKYCEMNSSYYDFKLKCEIKISKKKYSLNATNGYKFVTPCRLKSISKDSSNSAMQNQFRSLFISKRYSDVAIRCGNEEFPVHKFVLQVRSPVFAAMFDQDMLESKTGVVNIPDMDGKTMKAFLEYLYTETVDSMDYNTAMKLIRIAHRYEVSSLVDKCATFLKSNVSVENVCEIIVLADLLNCENLKLYALNFIKVNASEILPTADWTKWIEGNIKLATFILSKLSAYFGKS